MALFSGLYSDHGTAARSVQTYEDARVVATLVERQARFRWDGVLTPLFQQLAAAVFAATVRAGGANGRLRVCDFGGGLGGGRAILAAILDGAIDLDWDVVETPALARAGNARFAGPGLRFHESLDGLADREHDVIVVSGVLQYLPDPRGTFARLARRPHRHMAMNRFPLRGGIGDEPSDICTIQDLGLLQAGVSVPHWCFSEVGWRDLIATTHGTVMRWADDFDGRHPLDDGSEVSFVGMLLSRHPPTLPETGS